MSRHANVGTHLPRHEAKLLAAMYWGEHQAARARRRTVKWAADRAVPIGVTGDTWPIEVQP
jgi:hypothetical protein